MQCFGRNLNLTNSQVKKPYYNPLKFGGRPCRGAQHALGAENHCGPLFPSRLASCGLALSPQREDHLRYWRVGSERCSEGRGSVLLMATCQSVPLHCLFSPWERKAVMSKSSPSPNLHAQNTFHAVSTNRKSPHAIYGRVKQSTEDTQQPPRVPCVWMEPWEEFSPWSDNACHLSPAFPCLFAIWNTHSRSVYLEERAIVVSVIKQLLL